MDLEAQAYPKFSTKTIILFNIVIQVFVFKFIFKVIFYLSFINPVEE